MSSDTICRIPQVHFSRSFVFMLPFPIRVFLRNHCDISRWDQLPKSIKPLFDKNDVQVRDAEYFVASRGKTGPRFIITYVLASQLFDHSADAIALYPSSLALLIRFRTEERDSIESEGIMLETILRVQFTQTP